MREIKFRVFSTITKKMWSWEDMQNGCFSLFYRNPKEIWMQFTGLKDKNGKEIYEGDILKYWKTNLSKVVFEFGSFVAKEIKGKVGDGCGGSLWTNKEFTESECEVIGNIYENNNLLK